MTREHSGVVQSNAAMTRGRSVCLLMVFCATGSWLGMGIAVPAAVMADAQSQDDLEKGGPRIVVDKTEHHFGRVPDDRAVEHVFKVWNKGSKPLVVTRVQTSCGCTAAMMESSVIDPGKHGRLRVSFNPRGRQGTVQRSVSVHSNDPNASVVQLQVIAEVVPAGEEKKDPVSVKRVHPRREKLVFGGTCLKCHAPRKRSETGMKLYASSCAACHGSEGGGLKIKKEVIGPSLELARMTVKSMAGIRQVIAAGTGHPAMPGFSREYDGPLSEQQIDSLVDLILKKFPERK